VSTLAHASAFGLTLFGAILSFHFEGIVARCIRFRPLLFALEQNGKVFSAFGFDHDFARLIARLFGAGRAFSREFHKLPGSVGIDGFASSTMNIHEGKQSQ